MKFTEKEIDLIKRALKPLQKEVKRDYRNENAAQVRPEYSTTVELNTVEQIDLFTLCRKLGVY